LGIPDLKTAWQIVDGAGETNSGIILDIWHYMRGTRDDALLGSIPGEKITGVQLCDAPMKVPAGMSLAFEGLNNRLAPGDGEFPIAEILEVLRQNRGLNVVGLEIFSREFDQMSAGAIGERSRKSLDRLL
jgi:sugar phosphate isomerase/epimerase